jgi:hypothetical protein
MEDADNGDQTYYSKDLESICKAITGRFYLKIDMWMDELDMVDNERIGFEKLSLSFYASNPRRVIKYRHISIRTYVYFLVLSCNKLGSHYYFISYVMM